MSSTPVDVTETAGQGTYTTTEGTTPHPELQHEPRTIERRNGDVIHMMTEIDDGVFAAWSKCSKCTKNAQDCTCKTGPVPPDYIAKWAEERFKKSLRWQTKLVKEGERRTKGYTLVEIRGGVAETTSSENVTVLEVDYDELGNGWEYAQDLMARIDTTAWVLPAEVVASLRQLISEIWPEETKEAELRAAHPDMETPVICDTCGEAYDEARGEGYMGTCPECADVDPADAAALASDDPQRDDGPVPTPVRNLSDQRDSLDPGLLPKGGLRADLSDIDPGF